MPDKNERVAAPMPPRPPQNTLMKKRARILSRPQAIPTPVHHSETVLEFSVAGESYAIDTIYIEAVLPASGTTPVPCTPVHIIGVRPFRGEMLTLVDLRALLGLPERPGARQPKAVVISDQQASLGILAEKIIRFHRLPTSKIQPPSATLGIGKRHFIKGVALDRVAVLNAAQMLSNPDLVIEETV